MVLSEAREAIVADNASVTPSAGLEYELLCTSISPRFLRLWQPQKEVYSTLSGSSMRLIFICSQIRRLGDGGVPL